MIPIRPGFSMENFEVGSKIMRSGMMNGRQLILASASPRRAEILKQIGLEFQVMPSRASEEIDGIGAGPAEIVNGLALKKAKEVAGLIAAGLVIGADTVVVHEGKILGKPADSDEAFEMLSQLSGKIHTVFTGIALVEVPGGKTRVDYETTEVKFRSLTRDEIWAYIATNEPFDKAGAYGIQGRGAVLVEGIRGCFYNVVGLPVHKITVLLKEFGVSVWPRKA